MFDDYAGLVGRIYDTVTEPDAADAVLDEVVRQTRSSFMVIGLADAQAGVAITPRGIGDITGRRSDGITQYLRGETPPDPTLTFVTSRPGDRLFATDTHFAAGDRRRDAYMAWNRHYIGSSHWLARVSEGDGLNLVATVHPRDGAGAHEECERRLFCFLFDHLERAHRLAARRVTNGPEAVLCLDALGHVGARTASAEALLAASDGLRCVSRKLLASDPRAQRRLDALVAQALSRSPAEVRGGATTLERPSGRKALVVRVDPVPVGSSLAGPGPGARVLVVDPCSRTPSRADQFAAAWGLTPTEARLAAELLATGCDLRGSGDTLGMTYATVRTHLSRIFGKTDTRSQPELIRLLARLSG